MSTRAFAKRWFFPAVAVLLVCALLMGRALFSSVPVSLSVMWVESTLGVLLLVCLLRLAAQESAPPPKVIGAEALPRWRRWGSGHQMLLSGSTLLALSATFTYLPGVGADLASFIIALVCWCCILLSTFNFLTERRGSFKIRGHVRRTLVSRAPRAVLYVGRPDGGRYQVEKWLDLLVSVHGPICIVVRSELALLALSSLSSDKVSVAYLPRQSDLDLLPLTTLKCVYYPGSSALNTNMVSYRSLAHIYLGHGDSDKEISAHPSHRMYDRVFVAGQAAIDRYHNAGLDMPPGSLVKVGRPGLAHSRLPRRKGTTILYAPTWDGYNEASSLSSLSSSTTIVGWLIACGVSVIFRPHPLSRHASQARRIIERTDGIILHAGLQHLTSAAASKLSIEECMGMADGLVTDVSSMLTEFLPYGGKIAIFHKGDQSLELAYPSTEWASTFESKAGLDSWLEDDNKALARQNARSRYIETTDSQLFRTAVLEAESSVSTRSQ